MDQQIAILTLKTPDGHKIEDINLTANSFNNPQLLCDSLLEKIINGLANRVITVTAGVLVPCPHCAQNMIPTPEMGQAPGEMSYICGNPECPGE